MNDQPGLWITCITCAGQGRIYHQHDGNWWTTPCPTCHGIGADHRPTDKPIERDHEQPAA